MAAQCDNEIEVDTPHLLRRLQEHQSWLRRVIESRVKDASIADDVFQEVSEAALSSSNPPTSDQHFGPWLCRVALRQCALVARRAIRHRRLVVQVAERGESAAEPVDPIYWLIAEEQRDLVHKAFVQLDSQSRQILTWKYIERRTYEAIAQRLKITRHVCEYRVLRARQALRCALLNVGFEGDD